MIRALPPIVHDPEALFTARWAVRTAYARIRQERQDDPTIRCVLDELDRICVDLTNEIQSIQPGLQFPAVRVISIAPKEGM